MPFDHERASSESSSRVASSGFLLHEACQVQEIRCHACGAVQLHSPLNPRKPWRRILYERQDYPDNFVDDTFLSCLVTNANVRNPTFWSLVFDSLAITQQVSLTGIFLSVFWNVLRGSISTSILIAVDVLLIIFGGTLKYYFNGVRSASKIFDFAAMADDVLDLLKFLGILLGLSPVLKTLTSAYSDDTIWALSLVLCSVHIFLHDYSWTQPLRNTARFGGTISLNAAVFASILLASRLKMSSEVFAFVLFAFLVFAGFPFLARSIRNYSSRLHLVVTLSLQVLSLLSFSNISIAACVALFCSLFFVSLVCPFWLKWIKRYKNEIQGPWDYEAETVENIGK